MIWGGVAGGCSANCRSVTISGSGGGMAPRSTAMSTWSLIHAHHYPVGLNGLPTFSCRGASKALLACNKQKPARKGPGTRNNL